ncbi:MAG: hypothetical protein JSW11_14970 [Candidatus Heimdallarchaeota archaeon]|nr:MAG: hypothetical protein JSW11_14970 [Candidatus Heimdallarchaeota archaeon]
MKEIINAIVVKTYDRQSSYQRYAYGPTYTQEKDGDCFLQEHRGVRALPEEQIRLHS